MGSSHRVFKSVVALILHCIYLTISRLLFSNVLCVNRAERLRAQAIRENSALNPLVELSPGAAYGSVTAQQIAEAERLMSERNSAELRPKIKRGNRKGSGSYGFD